MTAAGYSPGGVRVGDAERALGISLPAALRALYETRDGIFQHAGQWWVVWPVDRVVRDTLQAWATGMLASDLVAFGDDGTGNPFCVRIGGGDAVLRWNWLDGAVERSEGDLSTFLRNWAESA